MSSAGGSGGAITIVIPPNIALLAGPQLLGLFLSWGLLGILSTQVYIYFLCFPRDPRGIKLLVYTLFIMEVVQTCLLSSDSFHWLVYGWGRPILLEQYYMSWFDVPVMVGMISCAVHFFFAWRIWVLARSISLVGIIVVLSLAQGSAGITSGIQLRMLPNFVKVGTLFPAVSVWHGGSALVDVIIAVTMTYLLTRAQHSLKDTNDFLSRLIRLTVETGMLTATVSTVDLILFNVFKENNLHMCPAIILAKLYTNTILAIFNNRIFASRSIFFAASRSRSTRMSTSIELGHSDFQGTWLRDAISQSEGGTQAGVSFQDTFSRIEIVQEHPLEPISEHPVADVGDEKLQGQL